MVVASILPWWLTEVEMCGAGGGREWGPSLSLGLPYGLWDCPGLSDPPLPFFILATNSQTEMQVRGSL